MAGMSKLLAPAAVGAYGMLSPEEAEASFVGEGAQGIYKGIIKAARKMADDGIPREDIWQKTWDMGGGAYKGPDGKWRVEVDDSAASVNDFDRLANEGNHWATWEGTAGQAVNNSPLLDAYPDIGDTTVSYDAEYGSAFFDPEEGITIGGKLPFESKRPIFHELQHVVQDKEGFARGGSPREFDKQEIASSAKAFENFSREFDTYAKRSPEKSPEGILKQIKEDYTENGIEDWLPEQAIMSSVARGIRPNEKTSALIDNYGLGYKTTPHTPMEAYKHLGGETEARNVEKRLGMSVADRRANAPWKTADIPEDRQINLYGNTKANQMSGGDVSRLLDANRRSLPAGSRLLLPAGAAPYSDAQAAINPRAQQFANTLGDIHERTVPVLQPFSPLPSLQEYYQKAAYGEQDWWDRIKVGLDFL